MSNFQQLISGITILAASGTFTFDIDTYNFKGTPVNISIASTYQATASSSGLVAYVYSGPGNPDNDHYTGGIPIVIGGTSKATYDTTAQTYYFTPPTLNSGGPQTVINSIEILCFMVPRWVRIVLLNVDPLNPPTINVVGDIP